MPGEVDRAARPFGHTILAHDVGDREDLRELDQVAEPLQGAQRGGICECLVAVADGRVESSPVIMQPVDGSVTMHPNAFLRVEPLIKPGGLLVYNTSIKRGTSDTKTTTGEGMALRSDIEIELSPIRTDIAYLGVPATELALEELKNPTMATLIAVGAFVELSSVVSGESVKTSLEDALPPHRHRFIPVNQKALDLGSEWARGKGELRNPEALYLFEKVAVAS